MKLISQLLFLLLIQNIELQGQSFSKPLLDDNSKQLPTYLKANDLNAVDNLNSKLIKEKPNDGVNYFNRAVIRYYKQNKYSLNDPDIVLDCKKAQVLGYTTTELYYLLFLEFFDYNSNGVGWASTPEEMCSNYTCNPNGIGFYEQKAFLDSAINLADYNNKEKYIVARFKL